MKGEGWVLSKRTWAPKGEERMLSTSENSESNSIH